MNNGVKRPLATTDENKSEVPASAPDPRQAGGFKYYPLNPIDSSGNVTAFGDSEEKVDEVLQKAHHVFLHGPRIIRFQALMIALLFLLVAIHEYELLQGFEKMKTVNPALQNMIQLRRETSQHTILLAFSAVFATWYGYCLSNYWINMKTWIPSYLSLKVGVGGIIVMLIVALAI